jgi:hypothetical protein
MASAGRGRGGRLLQSILTSKQKQEGEEEKTEPKQQTITPEAVAPAEEPVQKPPSPPRTTIRVR